MSAIKVTELLSELIKASEKSAQIARLCRAEEELFQLLVQEKTNESKNVRFVQDFKTLADVLVQETIKHDLALKFPGIRDRILGEENNKFENTLGEAVVVTIQKTCETTSALLLKVLDGNNKAADLLAKAVHSNQTIRFDKHLNELIEQKLEIELDLEEMGIWIDPIDSTSEYVNSNWETGVTQTEGIFISGLQCVTSLIGVYDTNTGQPLIGVANQPFVSSNDSLGRYYWGFDLKGIRKNNLSIDANCDPKGVVLIGGNETLDNINALKRANQVVYAAGAGNKLLTIAQGLADIYVNSQPSTYKWDTCALHAILRSRGGGIISFKDMIELKDKILLEFNEKQLNYFENKSEHNLSKKWCNSCGIIAYNSYHSLETIVNQLLPNNH